MMKIIKPLFVFSQIYYCLISTYAVANENLTITFFKVGQGSCALASFKEGPSILIDAGSSQIPGEQKDEKNAYKASTIFEITQKIKKPLKKSKWNIDLYVVVSHGDIDHYNWVKEIISNIKSYKTWNIQFLLGGKEIDYKNEFINFIKPYKKNNRAFFSDNYHQGNLHNIVFNVHEATCEILAALSVQDKNTNSIVLKIQENRGGGLSAIFTGDATKNTIDYITQNHQLSKLSATILQASHHGADSDGCNLATWFQITSPQYVVINAGDRPDYLHPRGTTLLNALESFNLSNNSELHVLQYGNTNRIFSNYQKMSDPQYYYPGTSFRFGNDYLIAITDRGIFNTHNQGHITFSYDINQPSLNIQYTEQSQDPTFLGIINYVLAKQHLIKDLIGFCVSNTITIDDPQLFFNGLIISSQSLRSCSFSGIHYSTSITENMLQDFLNLHPQLGNFECFSNTPVQIQTFIKSIWDNRGLKF